MRSETNQDVTSHKVTPLLGWDVSTSVYDQDFEANHTDLFTTVYKQLRDMTPLMLVPGDLTCHQHNNLKPADPSDLKVTQS